MGTGSFNKSITQQQNKFQPTNFTFPPAGTHGLHRRKDYPVPESHFGVPASNLEKLVLKTLTTRFVIKLFITN
jgi:hypothetical protein